MTELDPNIVLKSFATPQLDVAGLMQQRAQLQRQQVLQGRQDSEYAAQEAAAARQQQVGGLAASGDYAGADKLALGAGDFDLHKHIAGLQDEHRAQGAARISAAVPVAIQALTTTQDPAQRAAMISAAAPQLVNAGWKPEEIQAFVADPNKLTDQGLQGFIANARTTESALAAYDKRQEPFTLGQDQQRFDGGGHLIAAGPESIKAVTTPEGGTTTILGGAGHTGMGRGQIPFSALIGAESGGNQMGPNGQPLTSPKGAVGIAQVMPATAPEAAKAAGLPWDPNRYRTDASYNQQIGAAYYQKLQQRYGDDTKAAAAYNGGMGRVDKAVAQGGQNWLSLMPAETRAYVAKVGGGAPMTIHGAPKQNPDAPAPMDAQTIDYVAQQYKATGQLPPLGMGKQAAAMRAQIIGRAAQLAKADGSFSDAAGLHADFKANSAALSTLQRTTNQVLAYERTAGMNADQVLQTMGKGAGTTGVPVFNKWQQAGRRAVAGDPDVSRFDLAVQTFANEYARVTSGATGGAVTSDSARKEMEARVNSAQTPDQLRAVIDQAKKEMANRRKGLGDQANALRDSMKSRPGAQTNKPSVSNW